MLDEMTWQNASKFTISLEYEKKIHRLSYSKNMANFKAFYWVISSSINLSFLKSE